MTREERIGAYLEFARSRPELFQTPPGGLAILLDPGTIARVEDAVAADLSARGLDPSGAEVGVLLRDPWYFVLRDAVEFPDGVRRTHLRCVNRVDNGVAVLPVLHGRIVLLRHFRHAPRKWLYEIPRGGIEHGHTEEETAIREIAEEMGARIKRMVRMGFVHGSTNLNYNGAHLYFGELESVGEPQLSEGISAVEQLTVQEFEAMLRRGEIEDSFTIAAFLHARLRDLV